jgi:hypothetical protein
MSVTYFLVAHIAVCGNHFGCELKDLLSASLFNELQAMVGEGLYIELNWFDEGVSALYLHYIVPVSHRVLIGVNKKLRERERKQYPNITYYDHREQLVISSGLKQVLVQVVDHLLQC